MWEMSSKNLREKNDNNKRAYIEYLRRAGLVDAEVEITQIKMDGVRATVKLRLSLKSKLDKQRTEVEQDNTWVLEKGRWKFDNQSDSAL